MAKNIHSVLHFVIDNITRDGGLRRRDRDFRRDGHGHSRRACARRQVLLGVFRYQQLAIDEAGRATLLQPGTVIVTCRAGLAVKPTPVLIRPNRRPLQTDSQWRTDQESLVSSTAGENGVGDVLASLVDKLAPTAQAQFNLWGDNPKAALQIGTPPFTALEETRLGPVMPGNNFELPMPLVSLGHSTIVVVARRYP